MFEKMTQCQLGQKVGVIGGTLRGQFDDNDKTQKKNAKDFQGFQPYSISLTNIWYYLKSQLLVLGAYIKKRRSEMVS